MAGFGSLNLGHNHPEVVAAVTSALSQHAAGFSPASVNPLAAALAEQLVAITPRGLEMVFFTNSGAESIEAALKLARAATGAAGCCRAWARFMAKPSGLSRSPGTGLIKSHSGRWCPTAWRFLTVT